MTRANIAMRIPFFVIACAWRHCLVCGGMQSMAAMKLNMPGFVHQVANVQQKKNLQKINMMMSQTKMQPPNLGNADNTNYGGLRISRITSVHTSSFDAMEKIGKATSRLEIMKIALFKHKSTCQFHEMGRLPSVFPEKWEPKNFTASVLLDRQSQQPLRRKQPQSVLWAIDITMAREFQVEVGSWLLCSYTKDENHMNSLFSRTKFKDVLKDVQALSLVSPGQVTMEAVHSYGPMMWKADFIELQFCDELGRVVHYE